MEEVEVGDVLQQMLADHPKHLHQVCKAKFADPNLNYLATKSGLEFKFIASTIRAFGREVVLESLRRFQVGWSNAYFWGVCRKVADG